MILSEVIESMEYNLKLLDLDQLSSSSFLSMSFDYLSRDSYSAQGLSLYYFCFIFSAMLDSAFNYSLATTSQELSYIASMSRLLAFTNYYSTSRTHLSFIALVSLSR